MVPRMDPRTIRFWLLLSSAGGFASCQPNLSVPADALIACKQNSECPPPLICSPAGRCVGSDALDATPPEIGAFEQSRAWRAGDVAEFRFELSEAVTSLEVTLDVAGAGAPSCEIGPDSFAVCSYAVTGAENDGFGGIVPVRARATDRAGNNTERSRVGVLAFDFSPPALASASLTPSVARLGETIQFFLTVSEALQDVPTVTLDPPLQTSAGPLSSLALVQDSGTLNFRGAIAVDSEASGTVRFSTSLVDVPGNASQTFDLGTVSIDSQAPRVVAALVDPPIVRAGQVVTLTLDLDEAPQETPTARMGNELMSLQATGPGTHFVYTLSIDPLVFADNVYPVSIEAADAANNRLVTSLDTVRVDTTPPATVASVGPPDAKDGDTVEVLLTASEALGGAPVVSLTPPMSAPSGPISSLTLTQDSGTLVYRASVPVSALASGTVAFATQLTDAAGNTSSVLPIGSVRFDSQAPLVVSSTLSTNLAKDGTVVVLDLELSEIPALSPLVRLGDEIMLPYGSPVAPEYSFSISVDELVFADDIYPVSVDASDAAGNRLFGSLGSVRVDTTPPEVLAGTTSIDIRTDATMPDGVSALGGGATVQLSFLTSEPVFGVTGPPSLPVPSTTPDIVASFVAQSASNVSFSFEGSLVAGPYADGTYDMTFSMVDAAGNATSTTLGSLVVDRTPPAPVDTSGWVHLRVPWGSGATLGAAEHFLASTSAANASVLPSFGVTEACPPNCIDSAVVPSEVVELRVYTSTGSRLARIPRDTGGFGWTGLSNSDALRIFVSGVDRAGNEGPRTRVEQEEWLATLVGKVASSIIENPHRFETWPQDNPAFAVNRFSLFSDTVSTPAFGGQMASTRADPWLVQTARSGPITASTGEISRLVYDNVRHRVLMVNRSLSDAPGTVWTFNGEQWASIAPSDPEGDGNPTIRGGTAVAFDSRRGILFMFGGANLGPTCEGHTFCDILWEFDGQSWRAHNPPTAPGPQVTPRGQNNAAMSYDARRGVIVLFGGDNPETGVWEWDGSTWLQRCTSAPCTSSFPDQRLNHSMVYDPVRGVSVMHGGATSTPTVECNLPANGCDSTWEWDGNVWARMCTTSPCNLSTPGYRQKFGMAFDGTRVVVFGGSGTGGTNQNNLWSWDGNAWTQQCTTAPCNAVLPAGRVGHATTYFPGYGTLIGFGQSLSCPSGNCSDVWSFNGAAWTQQWPRTASAPVDNLGVVANSGNVFAFGGSTAQQLCSNPMDMAPMCMMSGSGPSKCAPGSLYIMGPELCFCSDGTTPLSGGPPGSSRCGKREFYRFTSSSSWQTICTTPPCVTQSPGGREGHAIASDDTGKIVVWGGNSPTGDTATYTYDGSVWTRYSVSAPGMRTNAAMTRAPGGGTLLFGGENQATCDGTGTNFCDGTWLWRGNTWTRCTSVGPSCTLTDATGDGNPARRANAAMAYDPLTGHAYLFGGHMRVGGPGLPCPDGSLSGASNDCFMNDLWRFDGSDWLRLDLALAPGAPRPEGRSKHSLYYDSTRRAIVLIGGGGHPNACDGFVGCAFNQVPCSCATDLEWVWNGSGWESQALIDPTLGGAPTRTIAPTFRAARADTGTFAVYVNNAGQTFKLYPGAEIPSHVARISLASATPDAFTLDDVDLSWTLGGTGDDGSCAAVNGAKIELWDGGWRTITTTPGSAGVGGTATWSAMSDPLLQVLTPSQLYTRLGLGLGQAFNVRARPLAAKGCQAVDARLVSESLQVRMRYH